MDPENPTALLVVTEPPDEIDMHDDHEEEEDQLSEQPSGQAVGELKTTLKRLLEDTLDKFKILDLARTFVIKLPEEKSFSEHKYLIQRFILLQLLKSDKKRSSYYERLLGETDKTLDARKKDPYICCLVGCLFSTETHRNYLNHLKSIHFNHSQLICNFKKNCAREFTGLQLLLNHVKESHSLLGKDEVPLQQVQEDVECRCDLLSCGGKKFKNTRMLLTHINNSHVEEERCCVFDQCNVRFSRGSTSRNHFRLKHTSAGNMKLKSKHLTVAPVQHLEDEALDGDGDVDVDDFYEESDADLLDIGSVQSPCSGEDEEAGDNFFQMQYADFLNRLSNTGFIPAKKVTEIADNYLQNAIKSREIRKVKLMKSLDAIPSLTASQKERIVKESVDDDKYLNAQQQLSSDYKRTKFIKENFNYVAPVQITLNSSKVALGETPDIFHYIPIKESFKQLIIDKSFNEVLEIQRENPDKSGDVLKDLRDGEAFKNNEFFVKNPGAYAALFYSDGVELSNPLSYARGRHKIVQVFYTLCQIPRSQRSQIDRTQVCMIFKDKLVKKYGYEAIFRPLVKDLKDLEEGIHVAEPVNRFVQLGVLAYSADNLEAHQLGGYSCCFSSKDICRFCHCTHSELLANIHDFDGDSMKKYWTKQEYDAICNKLEEDDVEEEEDALDQVITDEDFLYGSESEDDDDNTEVDVLEESEEAAIEIDEDESRETHGLKQRCPLNKLEAFHAVNSFPPDCMHDLLEGVVAQDLCGGIKILSSKGWFTLEEYNNKLKSFRYTSYESNDKPQEISKKAKKLSGKACSLWVHARNFPLILKDFVEDQNDEVLSLLLLLVDITARITATEFRHHEVDDLESKIVKYLDNRKPIYEAFPDLIGTVKPKHHFIR